MGLEMILPFEGHLVRCDGCGRTLAFQGPGTSSAEVCRAGWTALWVEDAGPARWWFCCDECFDGTEYVPVEGP